MNRHLSTLALVLLAAAACSRGSKPAGEGHAQYNPPYVFPHQPHVEGDVACLNCHAGIDSATKLDQHVALPTKLTDACSGCHDAIPKLDIPKRQRTWTLRFAHGDHDTSNCRFCHKELPEPGTKEVKAPSMSICTSCHNHQQDFAQARCSPCHVDLKEYELRPFSAFTHQGDWLRAHGPMARPNAATCAQCHDQTYCAACHGAATTPARPSIIFPEEVSRDFIHRGDYVSRHQVEAAANPASCRRCHGPQFCDTCHTQNNVTSRVSPNIYPHPDPAVWQNKASGNFHGDAARRDISGCAGCHDQGADSRCVVCHRAINPHPESWKSRHSLSDISKNRMCQICHTGP